MDVTAATLPPCAGFCHAWSVCSSLGLCRACAWGCAGCVLGVVQGVCLGLCRVCARGCGQRAQLVVAGMSLRVEAADVRSYAGMGLQVSHCTSACTVLPPALYCCLHCASCHTGLTLSPLGSLSTAPLWLSLSTAPLLAFSKHCTNSSFLQALHQLWLSAADQGLLDFFFSALSLRTVLCCSLVQLALSKLSEL